MRFKSALVLLLLMIADVSGRGGRGGGGRGISEARSASRSYSRSHTGHKHKFVKKSAKTGSIERTQLFRSAVFGAAAGYLIYQEGRSFIREPQSPILWRNRQYYWDSSYFVPSEELPTQCSNPIDPQDPQFGRVLFVNETRPREIVWGCPVNNQCCGYECCTEGGWFEGILLLALFFFVLAFVGLFVLECFRWSLHFFYSFRSKDFTPVPTSI